jgi:hypothetical protein
MEILEFIYVLEYFQDATLPRQDKSLVASGKTSQTARPEFDLRLPANIMSGNSLPAPPETCAPAWAAGVLGLFECRAFKIRIRLTPHQRPTILALSLYDEARVDQGFQNTIGLPDADDIRVDFDENFIHMTRN